MAVSPNANEASNVPRNILNAILTLLVTIGGITGVLASFLWLIGRLYGKGYYETVNIPISQIDLPASIYSELAWPVLLSGSYIIAVILVIELYDDSKVDTKSVWLRIVKWIAWILALVLPLICLYGGIILSYKIALYIIATIAIAIALFNASNKESKLLNVPRDRFITWGITFYLLVSFLSTIAYDFGTIDGRRYITEKAPMVRLILKEPIISHMAYTKLDEETESYIYENVYLITHNGDTYFLFSGISSECEPSQVYVVKTEYVKSIEYITTQAQLMDCIPKNAWFLF